jgi:transcription initiation factor TFIID subunit 5
MAPPNDSPQQQTPSQAQGQGQQQQGTPQQQGQQQQAGQQQRPAAQGSLPLADLNRIVLEYLNKKGYTRTEAMLRVESARTPTPAGGAPSGSGYNSPRNGSRPSTPIAQRPAVPEDPSAFIRGYSQLKNWTESSLDLYQPELRRILYPIFVHIFLELIGKNHSTDAKKFFDEYSVDHAVLHGHDIEKLSSISLPAHLEENELAKMFRNNKYQLKVSRTSFDLLLYFLHEIETSGGAIIIRLLNQYMETKVTSSRPSRFDTETSLDPEEGLPGQGGADQQVEKFNVQPIKLGKMPMDPEFQKDVTTALEQKDSETKEEAVGSSGANTLVDEFNQRIKQEEGVDSPMREALPLPQYKTADIEAEVMKVADSRSKISLGGANSTQASLPSVCMYTFHNTHEGLNCLDFSEDSTLVAGGFSDSFVKVWSLKGEKLTSVLKDDTPSNSKRLVGHSGPVFSTSFSSDNSYLLSASEDKTVRLWSLDTYTGLVSYKGHNHPVWDVSFSPFGHYFATASHDQTARLWSCDHIYPLRIFAGHISDVDTVSFHPNGTYVITGSSDKTCRMWDINRGNSVRVFIGHTAPINCTAVSPDGRWMASAGEDSIIHVWDLGTGRRLKSMRGHGRASIYSLAFSQEGSVLVSAGADNTVRVWDIKKGTNDAGPEPEPLQTDQVNGQAQVLAAEAGKPGDDGKKKKEIVATPDHMSVFNTKKTPVYKVHFTRRNLCLAGGAFLG